MENVPPHFCRFSHFSVDTDGRIRITSDENEMPLEEYHVIVKVTDSGTPPRAATVGIRFKFATLTHFRQSTYLVHVSEAQTTGTTLLTVTAEVNRQCGPVK